MLFLPRGETAGNPEFFWLTEAVYSALGAWLLNNSLRYSRAREPNEDKLRYISRSLRLSIVLCGIFFALSLSQAGFFAQSQAADGTSTAISLIFVVLLLVMIGKSHYLLKRWEEPKTRLNARR